MKFEDIKIGDIVFSRVYVKAGRFNGKSFYLPRKVTKTTKTQFTIEGGNRYKKENGRQIGERFIEVYKAGESRGGGKYKTVVKDETEEYNAYKDKLVIEKELRREIEGFKVVLGSGLSKDKIEDFLKTFRAFKEEFTKS